MLVKLPESLYYPITITRCLVLPGEEVQRLQTVLHYEYKTEVKEDTDTGEEISVMKTFPAQFESPVEGKLTRWYIRVGSVIPSSNIELFEIEEPCSHSVQYGGLCCECGKDMTERDYTSFSYADRATINMSHDNSGLTVSVDEATRLEMEAKSRLLNAKKLSLVVDLDQTIIHATVDPTVGEWKADPSNPNHEYVKDVQAFQLNDEIAGGRGCWYYVKMRPGLKEFLEKVSELYECHIYTMGTRAYALNVAKIVDPDGKIFSNRLLSRDESGSLTQKNLKRLFPVDTKMVVIIDDREDVWNYSRNLIKVRPYSFFVGIGDINSAFLPKKTPELPTATVVTKKGLALGAAGTPLVSAEVDIELPDVEDDDDAEEMAEDANLSTLEQLVTMSAGDDKILLEEQTEKLSEVIRAQQESRPLAKQQKLLDEQDGLTGDETSADGESTSGSESLGKHERHHLLHDDDRELYALEKNLRNVHQQFFNRYDESLKSLAQKDLLKDSRRKRRNNNESFEKMQLKAVPDVARIMPSMKKKTLEGCLFVFSGVIPIGQDVFKSDIAYWCDRFGAKVCDEITEKVTHLIAARPRTAKVRQAAARYPHIKIIAPQWLYDSISHWEKVPEDGYLIQIHPEDRAQGLAFTEPYNPTATSDDRLSEEDSDSGNSSDIEDDIDEEDISNLQSLENAEEPQLGNIDWATTDAELQEFLAEEGDTDDSDGGGSDTSMDSNDSRASKKKSLLLREGDSKKRARGEDGDRTASESEAKSDSDSEVGEKPVAGWRRQKRQKLASSNLRVVETVTEANGDPAVDMKEIAVSNEEKKEEKKKDEEKKDEETKGEEKKDGEKEGDEKNDEEKKDKEKERPGSMDGGDWGDSDFDLEQELMAGLNDEEEDG